MHGSSAGDGIAGNAPGGARRLRRLPGEEGLWVLIFGDLVVFGAFFVTFLIYRAGDPAMFREGRALLDVTFGLVNTLILLTSSLFVAQAVHLYRAGVRAAAGRLIIGAMLCGGVFLTLKAIEYTSKVGAGHTLNSSEFFIFYYMLTGIHALHVIIGLGVLAFMASLCFGKGRVNARTTAMEGGGVFWHLVDLLWIVIYPLLYLVS